MGFLSEMVTADNISGIGEKTVYQHFILFDNGFTKPFPQFGSLNPEFLCEGLALYQTTKY